MLGERIQQARKLKKISLKKMADAIGVSKRTLGYYEAGEREPVASTCTTIAELCSISIVWLLTGHPPEPLTKTSQTPVDNSDQESDNSVSENQNEDSMRNLKRVEGGPIPIEQGRSGRREGYVYVPRYDVTVVGGQGEIVHREEPMGVLAFRLDFIRTELGVPSDKLVAISASGNSMEPFIYPGDTLVINMADQQLTSDGVYVINYDGGLLVKRVEVRLDSEKIILKSDNKEYTPQEIEPEQTSQINVVGKVAWIVKKV